MLAGHGRALRLTQSSQTLGPHSCPLLSVLFLWVSKCLHNKTARGPRTHLKANHLNCLLTGQSVSGAVVLCFILKHKHVFISLLKSSVSHLSMNKIQTFLSEPFTGKMVRRACWVCERKKRNRGSNSTGVCGRTFQTRPSTSSTEWLLILTLPSHPGKMPSL